MKNVNYYKTFLVSGILLVIIISSCTDKNNTTNRNNNSNYKEIKLKYAELFEIYKNKKITKLIIRPVKNSVIFEEFYLIDKEAKIPENLKNKKIIRTPVEKVVCLSTTYVSFIDLLNETETIIGLSGTKYVNNKKVQKNIRQGKTVEVGYEQNVDIELLMSLKPDVVFAYNLDNNLSSVVSKADKLNIPFISLNAYRETEILGVSEWLKFFAEFYDKEQESENKFTEIAKSYNENKQTANQTASKPLIMTAMPWQGAWYVPGGKSYISTLISDAGGNYVWKNDAGNKNLALSLEDVYNQAQNADIWINTGQANCKQDIISTDKRLEMFTALKNDKIFNRNARTNINGGNDYFESGTVRPDIILKDLIKIFHPELLPEHKLYYYKKIFSE